MIVEQTEKPVDLLQKRILILKDQITDAEQRLAHLHAEFTSIREGLAVVATDIQPVAEVTREERLAKAKHEIFTEYDSLLSELAK